MLLSSSRMLRIFSLYYFGYREYREAVRYLLKARTLTYGSLLVELIGLNFFRV